MEHILSLHPKWKILVGKPKRVHLAGQSEVRITSCKIYSNFELISLSLRRFTQVHGVMGFMRSSPIFPLFVRPIRGKWLCGRMTWGVYFWHDTHAMLKRYVFVNWWYAASLSCYQMTVVDFLNVFYLQAKKQMFKAHASKVGRIRFNCEDNYVVSIGAVDRSVMQWKVLPSWFKSSAYCVASILSLLYGQDFNFHIARMLI